MPCIRPVRPRFHDGATHLRGELHAARRGVGLDVEAAVCGDEARGLDGGVRGPVAAVLPTKTWAKSAVVAFRVLAAATVTSRSMLMPPSAKLASVFLADRYQGVLDRPALQLQGRLHEGGGGEAVDRQIGGGGDAAVLQRGHAAERVATKG